MLGMMNAPSDNVDFYSGNQRALNDLPTAQKEAFTGSKDKASVEYTKDGRRLVNGKPEVAADADQLWKDAIQKGAVYTQLTAHAEKVVHSSVQDKQKLLEHPKEND